MSKKEELSRKADEALEKGKTLLKVAGETTKGGEKTSESTVTVDFEHHVIDSWDYEVGGKTYHVEKGGTEVPASKADELIAASQRTGAVLHKV